MWICPLKCQWMAIYQVILYYLYLPLFLTQMRSTALMWMYCVWISIMVWSEMADLIHLLTVILWTHFTLDNPNGITLEWKLKLLHRGNESQIKDVRCKWAGQQQVTLSLWFWSCDWWSAVRGRGLRGNTCLPASGESKSWIEELAKKTPDSTAVFVGLLWIRLFR